MKVLCLRGIRRGLIIDMARDSVLVLLSFMPSAQGCRCTREQPRAEAVLHTRGSSVTVFAKLLLFGLVSIS